MRESNGMPVTGESARTLGVRQGTDIHVDSNGMVRPGTGGMSASPSIEDLPPHRKPPAFGGTGKDPVWEINEDDLGPDLVYVPDSPGHGTIQPSREMTYEEYKNALENTQDKWRKVPCPS
jgi:hypothetical protein